MLLVSEHSHCWRNIHCVHTLMHTEEGCQTAGWHWPAQSLRCHPAQLLFEWLHLQSTGPCVLPHAVGRLLCRRARRQNWPWPLHWKPPAETRENGGNKLNVGVLGFEYAYIVKSCTQNWSIMAQEINLTGLFAVGIPWLIPRLEK